MARQIGRVVLVVILLFTAACTSNDGDTLPTSAALPTDDPATEVPVTEVPVEEEATPTAEVLLATAESLRPTLPPTFTPTVEGDSQQVDETDDASAPQPSDPTSTPSSETSNPPPATSGERPACVDFAVDLQESTSTFALGTQPVAAWTAIDGAESYFLELSNQSGFVILTDIYIAETTYTFDADLFEDAQAYGWSVYPLDANGDQMCFTRGSEMVVQD